MYTRIQRGYLHVLEVLLGFALVFPDNIMEVEGPLCEPQEQALRVPLATEGQSYRFVLPQVGGSDAAVESEPTYPVHAVQDPAHSRQSPDSEHVLVHHGNRLEDTLSELLPEPLRSHVHLQCKGLFILSHLALNGVPSFEDAHHQADRCQWSVPLDHLF